jgi:transglutaminase-like putative cysteine protease
MTRTVGVELDVQVNATTQIELQVAAARVPGLDVDETLTITLDGAPMQAREVSTPQHGRMHLLDEVGQGQLEIRYEAHLTGRGTPLPADPYDLSVMQRPSRYVSADTFAGFAFSEFGETPREQLLTAVSSWVGTRLRYVPGSSGPTDGATDTLLQGAGVCRDYAHLVIALLRAIGVPARLVAVYAPGCDPMDFHAVAEAYVEGGWHAVDATALAPRSTLARIATGRDAADTAFMTNNGGNLWVARQQVTAVADAGLPDDDLDQLVQLG